MTKKKKLQKNYKKIPQFTFLEIPRARRVHQSFLSTPYSSLICFGSCLWYLTLQPILNRVPFPDLVLLNGPGSAVPIALSTFLPRVSELSWMDLTYFTIATRNRSTDDGMLCLHQIITLRPTPRLVYVESLARVKSLSLSGLMLLPLMDVFIVQWDGLAERLRSRKVYQVLDRWGFLPPLTLDGWMV